MQTKASIVFAYDESNYPLAGLRVEISGKTKTKLGKQNELTHQRIERNRAARHSRCASVQIEHKRYI